MTQEHMDRPSIREARQNVPTTPFEELIPRDQTATPTPESNALGIAGRLIAVLGGLMCLGGVLVTIFFKIGAIDAYTVTNVYIVLMWGLGFGSITLVGALILVALSNMSVKRD